MIKLQTELHKQQVARSFTNKRLLTLVYIDILNRRDMKKQEPETTIQTLAYRIRSFRKLRGVTQAELAKKSDLTTSYIVNIEGAKRPSVSLVVVTKIVFALGITVNELIYK